VLKLTRIGGDASFKLADMDIDSWYYYAESKYLADRIADDIFLYVCLTIATLAALLPWLSLSLSCRPVCVSLCLSPCSMLPCRRVSVWRGWRGWHGWYGVAGVAGVPAAMAAAITGAGGASGSVTAAAARRRARRSQAPRLSGGT
jgi:hypothetical protein